MSRTKFWGTLRNTNGRVISDANVRFRLNDTNELATVYSTPTSASGDVVDQSTLTTNSSGYFEFFVGDFTESDIGGTGYDPDQLFKLTWTGDSDISGTIDDIQLFERIYAVDATSTNTTRNKTLSNQQAYNFRTHRSSTYTSEPHEYQSADWTDQDTEYNRLVSNYQINHLKALARSGSNDVTIGSSPSTRSTYEVRNASWTASAGSRDTSGSYPVYFTYALSFASSGSQYMETLGTSASGPEATLSLWIRRIRNFGTKQVILDSMWEDHPGSRDTIYFDTSNRLVTEGVSGGSSYYELITTDTYADSDWHHYHFNWSPGVSDESDRVKIWVDGTQVTSFDTETYPPRSEAPGYFICMADDYKYTGGKDLYRWTGAYGASADFGDFHIAEEYNFIDAETINPSAFGATTNNGYENIYAPAYEYTGGHGNIGFRYLFIDADPYTDMGEDYSTDSELDATLYGMSLSNQVVLSTNSPNRYIPSLPSASYYYDYSHNLGNSYPIVQLYDTVTAEQVSGSVYDQDTNTIRVYRTQKLNTAVTVAGEH